MAYVTDEILEEENLEGEGQNPVVPSGGIGNTAAPTTTSESSAQTPKTPGRFADLDEYLRVNAPQEFGSELAGKIGEDINAGQETLDTSSGEFRERADSATIRDTQGLVDKVSEAPEEIDVDAFAGLRDAQYQGPVRLSDTQDLYGRVKGAAGSAVGKAEASKSEGGRFALLDDYFGRPQYSQGEKSLDNLLVQNDQNSQQAFDQMRQNAQALQTNVKGAEGELGDYGTQAKAATEATRQSARSALGIDDAGNLLEGQGAIGQTLGNINSQLEARKSQAREVNEMAQSIYGKQLSELSPEQLSYLGVDPSSLGGFDLDPKSAVGDYAKYYEGFSVDPGQNYGLDIRDYLTPTSEQDLNAYNSTDPAEQARLRVLEQLADLEGLSLEGDGDAGSLREDPLYSFNNEAFNTERTNREDTTRAQLEEFLAKLEDTPEPTNDGQVGVTTSDGSGGLAVSEEVLRRSNEIRVKNGLPPIEVFHKGAYYK